MKIKQSIINNQLILKLPILLENIPESILFYKEYGLRHPAGIFALSNNRVMQAFQKVIHELEFCGSNSDGSKLLDSQKELLNSLMAFVDDGYHILKCLFPKSRVHENIKFADKWLEKIEKREIQNYKRKIKEYRDFFALIDNKLKHNHARLQSISMKTEHGLIAGYYVVGVDNKGVLGTDLEIHKKFRNQDTGFSFNRHLKMNLMNYYFICHHLEVLLRKLIKKNYDQNIENSLSDTIRDEAINLTVIKNISSLPYLFFPDESFKPYPLFKVEDSFVEIEFPGRNANVLLYGECEIQMEHTIERFNPSARMLYWEPGKGWK